MIPVRAIADQAQTAALARYHLFDGPPEPDLQTVVELAAQLCQVPISVLFVIDADSQHQVAAVGIDTEVCRREDSMCSVAMAAPDPMFIEDARTDPRFVANPFVTGRFQRFRFYGSTQLRPPEGFVLGTLCVFDEVPRVLDEQQRQGLDRLARMAIDVLELRRHGFLVADLLRRQQQIQAALEGTNETLRHFAAQLAHDLRNPLTGISAYAAELHLMPTVNADADASLCTDRISAAALRMGTLIDDVLAHATTDHARHAVEVNLTEITNEVLDDLAVQISEANADVTVNDLPTVIGDRTQWHILLQNLVSNAVKYRHAERACHIAITAADDPAGYRVCVTDNGIGIPASQREQAAQPFTRLSPGHSTGHGIGLSTCARIVHTHGGRLDISDTPGGGTTVCITMPTDNR
ncbi:GAF sensor signal transduction histidine kinase [Actinoplanes sp. SE50]|nr:GAF sensor signal transduction histidine kinase [Actinoplanes sp. SE50/110]ATO82754.1 GAF sensor signal transduction histidine kinase [Actinoplanes sp. SE50]SLM00161.1 GAF sensor signal transduction histidine kinase [Actinoplanes sp. SE50/110]